MTRAEHPRPQVCRRLDPHRLIIDQDLGGLLTEAPIDREPEVVPPNLAILALSPSGLTERGRRVGEKSFYVG